MVSSIFELGLAGRMIDHPTASGTFNRSQILWQKRIIETKYIQVSD